jgi:DNA modification methylase
MKQQVKISKVKGNPDNPRIIKNDKFKKLVKSIQEFPEMLKLRPIVVDEDMMVLGGNMRLKASKDAGLKEVWIEIAEGLTEEQKKEFIVKDNVGFGEWEWDMLANEWDSVQLAEWGLDVWENEDDKEPEAGLIEDDEIPEVKESKVKRGDIWQLGEHRIMCGDSTSSDDVEKLMNGEKADMVFTDPPYNIDFKPPRGTHDKILNDSMSDNDFSIFLDEVFNCSKNSLKDDTYLFVWCGWSTTGDFKKSLIKLFDVKALHIWVKNNFGIGYYSRPKYEPFFLCLNGKPVKPKVAPADVWEYAKVHKTIHSCEKPVGLIIEILDTYFLKGLVIDLFLGSGSTLIAAEKTKRKCYGMELDEKYCDVIIERWEQFTGQKAIKNGTE